MPVLGKPGFDAIVFCATLSAFRCTQQRFYRRGEQYESKDLCITSVVRSLYRGMCVCRYAIFHGRDGHE